MMWLGATLLTQTCVVKGARPMRYTMEHMASEATGQCNYEGLMEGIGKAEGMWNVTYPFALLTFCVASICTCCARGRSCAALGVGAAVLGAVASIVMPAIRCANKVFSFFLTFLCGVASKFL